MATYTNTTKNSVSISNQSKNTVVVSDINVKSIGIWSELTFPWQELLPWTLPSNLSRNFNNITKSI